MKLFSTVLLALISQAVYAYEVGYEVEVIIFENASDMLLPQDIIKHLWPPFSR